MFNIVNIIASFPEILLMSPSLHGASFGFALHCRSPAVKDIPLSILPQDEIAAAADGSATKGQEDVQKCKMSQQSHPNLFTAENWRSGRWRLLFAASTGEEGASARTCWDVLTAGLSGHGCPVPVQ